MKRVTQGQNLAEKVGQKVAKVAITRVYNTKIDNKKRLQINLVKRTCKMRAFMSVCNIIEV